MYVYVYIYYTLSMYLSHQSAVSVIGICLYTFYNIVSNAHTPGVRNYALSNANIFFYMVIDNIWWQYQDFHRISW